MAAPVGSSEGEMAALKIDIEVFVSSGSSTLKVLGVSKELKSA